MFETLLFVLMGAAAAQASPGPSLVAVATAAISGGRQAAFCVTLGISSGILFWGIAIALGLGSLIQTHPVFLTLMKVVGGGYLLWLALKGLKAAIEGKQFDVTETNAAISPFAYWKHGLFVVLTNPKAVLMWSAVASFLFGSGFNSWQVLAFGPALATTAFIIYGSYGLLFSTGTIGRGLQRFSRVINVVLGTVFGALGASLLVDAWKSSRPV